MALKNIPNVSLEEQGMEMTPKVMGPPAYGSPDPKTATASLVAIEDHVLDIPEDYGSEVTTHFLPLDEAPADSVAMPSEQSPGEDTEIDATDTAAELAAEHGVDLADVEGTGANGRITKADVQAYIDESDSDDE